MNSEQDKVFDDSGRLRSYEAFCLNSLDSHGLETPAGFLLMLTKWHSLIIEDDMGARTRLREVLSQVIYKGRVEYARNLREAQLAISERTEPEEKFQCCFVSSALEREDILTLHDELSEHAQHTVIFVVLLKASQQDSAYIASLFLQGVHGFLNEPFSSDGVLSLLESAQQANSTPVTDGVVHDSLLRFVMGDAARHLDDYAQATAQKADQVRARKRLVKTSKTISDLREKVDPEVFSQALVESFLDCEIPKHYKGRSVSKARKQAVHPASRVREYLEKRKLTLERFKGMWKLDQDYLAEFLAEKSSISKEAAQELARILGESPRYWERLQTTYDKSQEGEKTV